MSGPERLRCAVAAAETGSQWWALAARTQREKTGPQVDHVDLYGLAGEVVATLRTLDVLADTLARQTAGYGRGRVLRDDAGAAPGERLTTAATFATALVTDLQTAGRRANDFWSAIGHLAVEPPLDPDDDHTTGTDSGATSCEGER